MTTSVRAVHTEGIDQANAARLGHWAALLLAVLTLIAFGIGIFTPPRSGPFCTGACIAYPYSNAAQFVPRDFIWMAPGILLTPVFVVVMACIHACAEKGKQHLTLIALCFAAISAAIITLDYSIQLAVIQPSLLHAETEDTAIFSQYNPHGIFIALEDLGYLALGAAFAFAGTAFPLVRGITRTLRWTLLGGGILSFASFVGLSWSYGLNMGLIFEITVISIVWMVLIISGFLLFIYFGWIARRRRSDGTPISL